MKSRSLIKATLSRILREPPIRLLAKAVVAAGPFSSRTKAFWDAVARPQYLHGVLTAADHASRLGVTDVSVFEFGVAGGSGLRTLEMYSARVERETGVRIAVFGFDTGAGLPESTHDYRDHPDLWQPGEYRMDADALMSSLGARTRLILGNIRDTLPRFLREGGFPPVGFVSIDLDYYSSTKTALELLHSPARRMLPNVPVYFDDIVFLNNHRYAGELLAIHEFNEQHRHVKIDKWYGIEVYRPFQESYWLRQMYVAHDLEAISGMSSRQDSMAGEPLGMEH